MDFLTRTFNRKEKRWLEAYLVVAVFVIASLYESSLKVYAYKYYGRQVYTSIKSLQANSRELALQQNISLSEAMKLTAYKEADKKFGDSVTAAAVQQAASTFLDFYIKNYIAVKEYCHNTLKVRIDLYDELFSQAHAREYAYATKILGYDEVRQIERQQWFYDDIYYSQALEFFKLSEDANAETLKRACESLNHQQVAEKVDLFARLHPLQQTALIGERRIPEQLAIWLWLFVERFKLRE